MEHGYTGVILEGAVHQIKIVAGTTHGGVGMKTGENGVAKALGESRQCQQEEGGCE
jgi:hypothetical protein